MLLAFPGSDSEPSAGDGSFCHLGENGSTPSKRNPSLRGGRTIFHKRWQKDPPGRQEFVAHRAEVQRRLQELARKQAGSCWPGAGLGETSPGVLVGGVERNNEKEVSNKKKGTRPRGCR